MDLPAQTLCTGNLGDNIFTDGDFGSGTDKILQKDPKIAPGYTYTTFVPPPDGSYTIASTSDWITAYPTWIRIKDHSSDPNGYMMIINASLSPGLFYEQTVNDLCDNTLYEFSADIINMVSIPTLNHILPNVSFLLDDKVVFNTGGIPQSEHWNNVGFTFVTQPGQTSVKLSLRNNAPGGNGNDLAIDNISFRACGPKALILPNTVANICEDGNALDLHATIDGKQFPNPALQWQMSKTGTGDWVDLGKDTIQKHTILKSGIYYYRYLLAVSETNLKNAKCRLVSNIKIIHVQAKFYTIEDTICQGVEYTFGKRKFTQTGTYVDSLHSRFGCDSIVTLKLVVQPDLKITSQNTVVHPTCVGYHDASIFVKSITQGYAPYTVTLNSKITNNNSFTQLTRGSYSLKIVDHYGCTSSQTILINDPPLYKVKIDSLPTIKLGEQITLHSSSSQAINSSQYYFENNTICNQQCEGKSYLPFHTGRLTVLAKNDQGCSARDSILLTVNDEIAIYIPNIFTPNGDGKNDLFRPFTTDLVVREIASFRVFNRYGGVVYEALHISPQDATSGWDGTVDAKQANSGVYVYQVELVLINDRVVKKKGDIVLIR